MRIRLDNEEFAHVVDAYLYHIAIYYSCVPRFRSTVIAGAGFGPAGHQAKLIGESPIDLSLWFFRC